MFLKPYLSEKGKNVATKEDIEQIQNAIEKVRTEYNKQIELTKGIIQFDVLSNKHLLEKSTEILLQFYDDIIVLTRDNLSKSLGDVIGPDYKLAIVDHTQNTLKLFTNIRVNYHRLLIFLDGQVELASKCVKIALTISDIEKVYKRHTGKLKLAAIKEQEAIGTSAYIQAVNEHDNVVSNYHKELKPLTEILNSDLDNFVNSLMQYFRLKKIAVQ